MKKPLSILIALVMGCSVAVMAACNNSGGKEAAGLIRLRSEQDQKMNVGDTYKLVYDAKYNDKNVKDEVQFKSSDENVVKVDEYGNMEAVGAGSAVVTLSLKQDETINAKVFCEVTKSFFMTKAGYSNGDVDPLTADVEGWVHIKAGTQTQLLVNECSENWYFKTKIEHTGDTGADSSGRWGIGSFLVDKSHAIGDVMAWFGFQPTNHSEKKYTPYVGGWKVQTGGMDAEIQITQQPLENADFAVMEIIRFGTEHYCTVTVGSQVAKYVYSCPAFDGVATYPGVYSQRQRLYISEFEATSNLEEVVAKLNNFQKAESVVINGVSSGLEQGETYNLVATVLPETTFDKGVKFTLKEAVEGVSITENGALTIGAEATGEVTVVATATSSDANVERTYAIKAKAQSAHAIVDTNKAVGASDKYSLSETAVTYEANSGKVYLPLNATAEKWAVSYETNLTSGRFGLLGATNGMCDYVAMEVGANKLTYGAMTEAKDEIAVNTSATNTVTFVRDGSFYYTVVNGRLVERFYNAMNGATTPVLYTDGAVGTINNLTLVTDGTAVDGIIAQYPHTVGAYVTDNGEGSYTIAKKSFGAQSDIDWPPVNNYENGLKFAQTVTGDFTMEFTMSGFDPMTVNGEIDAKVLVYLRSESKTASLQFCFKQNAGDSAVRITFCPNLNDATWNEYTHDCLNSFNQPVAVKVVKKADCAELYINGERVFADISGMNNNGFWTESTPFTPGIGTYRCGVTLSNVSLTVGNE